ncbi:hypothetical protein IFM89_004232 [Coptis chinensis]|uniref:Uncharacterized protein n=1 Tax=Coptis chinensis TaxID=261450 RepID=A0A835IAL5_9MAGN|nr:hypothetical protein IFM89_004232 [Coptis chinensis]
MCCSVCCVGYQFDGGKSKKQTKIIAPQLNDHAHLKLLNKELDGLCGAALGFIVSEAITNTCYENFQDVSSMGIHQEDIGTLNLVATAEWLRTNEY